MKKFLSLVLALVMAMSLVTISAGATEYKDLTDKDEIQYEEAVAVLNRIGVITGYTDGSFQPKTELTRGAAAKIIVSLLIGPEAASNLPNNYAPYPDVPAGHTFAGVISFCKTKNIISGYGDGTFKPGNTLTGYAFAKMLLGAVGYDAQLEKFVDTGWTMNVASVGQSAGLFDRLKFDGSKAVTREEACQLALNALKATVVQYSQGINVNVTGDNTNVVVSGGQTRSYKTSNQEFARNIRTRTNWVNNPLVGQVDDDYYTVEFAEEHFVDLRLEHDKWNPTRDDFGRPSAEWSYKKVTIGTYALEPDFEFTTQIAHKEATTASRERATGLGNYDLEGSVSRTTEYTNLWLNGERVQRGEASRYAGVNGLEKIYEIADLTDNGNLVQVYVSNVDADFITDVVVIQTQLMEVKRVNSEYVSLDRVSPASKDAAAYGYNLPAIHEEVSNVREDDEAFAVLSTLKSGDKVAIIPVADDLDGTSFSVSRAYVPETVTGQLQKATSYANVGTDRNAVDVTVGGTTYKVANWSKDLVGIDANKIKITRKDVTLLLDEYGNALLGKDVGEDSEYMIVGNWGSTLMNGRIVNLVEGWTVGGEAVSLNVGTRSYPNIVPGDLVKYTSDGATGSAEWVLVDGASAKIYNVDRVTGTNAYAAATTTPDNEVKSSNVRVSLENITDTNTDEDRRIASDCKFIYVDFDENTGDVETIEFVKTRQNISPEELDKYNTSYGKFDWNNVRTNSANGPANTAEAYLKDDFVKAIVVKTESNNSNGQLAYVANYTGYHQTVNDGGLVKAIWGYEVIMPNSDGELEMLELYTTKDYDVGTFIRYTKAEAPAEVTEDKVKDNFYTTSTYSSTEKATSVALLQGVNVLRSGYGDNKYSKDLIRFTYGFKTNESNLKSILAGNGSYLNALVSDEAVVDTTVITDPVSGATYTVSNASLDRTGKAAVVSGYRGLGNDIDQNPRTLRVDADSDAWYDLRDTNYRDTITSVEDLTDYVPESIALAIVFNDKRDSDNFRSVSRVIVLRAIPKGEVAPTPGSVTITTNAPAGVLGAGNVILDPTGTISFTATTSGATGKGVEYKFVWKVNGTVVRTQYTSGLTDTWTGDTGANLQGKTVTCEVTCTTDDKPISSEAASVTPIVFAAPVTPDSVSVGAEGELMNGVPATFKATVKDAEGEEITGAALSTMNFAWGYVEAGVFKAFSAKQMENLGITVNEDGTMTVADPAKITGMTISCEVSAGDTTVEAPTTGSDIEDVPPTLPDDPDATSFTVKIVIGNGTKVTLADGTVVIADRDVTVNAGELLTLTAATAVADAEGILNVVPSEGITVFNGANAGEEQQFKVTKSGTITVSFDTPDLAKVAARFTKTTLVDRSESDALSEAVLNDGYGMTSEVSGDGIKLTFTHTGLYWHKNMNGTAAWMLGFNMDEAADADGWTVKANGLSVESKQVESKNVLNFGPSPEGGYWLTLYQQNADAVTSDPMAMGDNGITTGTVTVTKGDTEITIPVTIDCSGVRVHTWGSARPASTPAAE